MFVKVFRSSILCVSAIAVTSFAANNLSSGGHLGIVRSQTADVLGAKNICVGGVAHYGQEADYIHSVTRNGVPVGRDGSSQLISGDLFFGVGIAPIMDIGLNLPMYYDRPHFGGSNAKGIGDLEVSLKLAGFALKGDEKAFTGAYYLGMQFPTGDAAEGFFPRHAYYGSAGNWSSDRVIFLPRILGTLHFDRLGMPVPMTLNLNLGGAFNAPEDNNAVTASVGVEAKTCDYFSLFVEASGEERFLTLHKNSFFPDLINDPIYMTPGCKLFIPDAGLTFTLAADLGISEFDRGAAQISYSENGYTIRHQANPLYNVFFGISWSAPAAPKDPDSDGIKGTFDLCPQAAEDKDGYQDEDGCPENDNDGDSVADASDKCPNEAGIAANNGCPDFDSDKDGIVDRLDKCPQQAEDKDGFQDEDGCPDADNDNDSIADAEDKCPTSSGIVENNGCPDVDTDKDGIVDRLDKCPNNPGTVETEGCPKSKEITRGALILKGVTFESGKAILKAASSQALNEMAESLREWPEVTLEIQGHTDNVGAAQFNRTLSQQRADAVRQYLIDKGIDGQRLTSIGYGPDKPIAENKTAAGRAQNRRVEINRTN
jgi:outer membrane protein OmpA-like peptidoglycan-associated protein